MSTQVQYRRGNSTQNNAFTGALAEITVDTTNNTLRVHDGVTPGGTALLTASNPVFTGNLIPAANVTYSLGSPTAFWNDLYLAGNTIFLGSLQLKDIGSNTFAVYTSDGTTQANIDVGSIDVSAITSGNSAVGISTPSGNAYMQVNNTQRLLVTPLGINVTGNGNFTGNVTVAGNVELGHAELSGTVTATGNVTGGNLVTAGKVVAPTVNAATIGNTGAILTGNLSTAAQPNVTSVGTLTGLTVSSYISSDNIQGRTDSNFSVSAFGTNRNVALNPTGTGNVTTPANLVVSGNITGGNLSGTNIVGTLTTASQTNITAVGTLGGLSVTGNASAGNLSTGGLITATGNVTGGNLNTAGNVVASGYLFGNGSQLTGIDATSIQNGSANVRTFLNGNVTTSAAGTANVLVVTSTGANIAGTLNNGTGNANLGNLGTTNVVATNLTGTLQTAAQTNITSVGTLSTLSVTGNVTGGNLITGGVISATGNANVGNLGTSGNITASYLFGNGSQLTGIDATSIQNGTSNVRVNSSGGNVTTSVGGQANVVVVTSTGANVAGYVNATGNITGGNVAGGNLVSANYLAGTLTTAAQPNVTSVGTLTSLAVSGNITPGGISMSTGNATIGNLYVSGTATIAGNIQQISGNSGQFFGNASTGFNALYAGLPAGYSLVPQSVVNFITSFDGYSQVNLQNINAGNTSTSDYIVTSDEGDDTTHYVDLGIAGSTYNGTYAAGFNSLGNVIQPGDGYLYVTGDLAQARIGNMAIGTPDNNSVTTIFNSGSGTGNISAQFFAPNLAATSATTGTFRVKGGIATSGTVWATGNITGNYILGNGSQLTGIDATSIQSGTSSMSVISSGGNIRANIAGATVQTLSTGGANVTGYVTATGNVSGGNLTTSGNITAAYLFGNGSQLTGIDATAIQNGSANVRTFLNGNVTVSAAGTANVLVITSTGANISGTLNNGTSNANLGNLGVTAVIATNLTGTLQTAAQTNITSVGTLTGGALGTGFTTVGLAQGGSGQTTAQTAMNAFAGAVTSGSYLRGNGTNVVMSAIQAGDVPTLNQNTTGTASTVTSAAQANITSVGTLTSLTVSGGITVNSTNGATAITNGGTAGTGNIGASGQGFNTVFAKATSAQYADLAEMYCADAEYAPGTVLVFGGNNEVTIAATQGDTAIAGVVSTAPAHLMNSNLECDHAVVLALTGRVPTKVVGTVRKGQMMISAGNGYAMACTAPTLGSVIGKALENFDGESGVIEVVVGRL